jgi:hypothetical protein
MGERPKGMTLDRIKNELNYAPDNCRWVTWRQQEGNRRDNIWVIVNGEAMITAEAARRFNMPDYAFRRFSKKVGGYQIAVDILVSR